MKPFDSGRLAPYRDLLMPLVMATVGMGLLLASTIWSSGERRELARFEQQLAEIDARRLELAERVQARERYAERFHRLQAAGIAGDAQRLAWAEAFGSAAHRLRLPYLRYSALPQQNFDLSSTDDGAAVPVLVTTVDVQAGLVHELDLLRMIDLLRTAPGLLEVAGCDLQRMDAEGGVAADRANLGASCQLRWFTIPLQANETATGAEA